MTSFREEINKAPIHVFECNERYEKLLRTYLFALELPENTPNKMDPEFWRKQIVDYPNAQTSSMIWNHKNISNFLQSTCTVSCRKVHVVLEKPGKMFGQTTYTVYVSAEFSEEIQKVVS